MEATRIRDKIPQLNSGPGIPSPVCTLYVDGVAEVLGERGLEVQAVQSRGGHDDREHEQYPRAEQKSPPQPCPTGGHVRGKSNTDARSRPSSEHETPILATIRRQMRPEARVPSGSDTKRES